MWFIYKNVAILFIILKVFKRKVRKKDDQEKNLWPLKYYCIVREDKKLTCSITGDLNIVQGREVKRSLRNG